MYSHVACDVMKERTLSAKAEFIDMALNAISFLVISVAYDQVQFRLDILMAANGMKSDKTLPFEVV